MKPMISVGDFVDFFGGGQHWFARVEKVKSSPVTGTKVTVETFWSCGMKGEKFELGRKTVPVEHLVLNRPDRNLVVIEGVMLSIRELYEMVVNR